MELATEEKINEALTHLKIYSKIQVELLRLRTIEKAAMSGSYIISRFLLFSTFAVTLFFLSIAASFYMSQLLGSIISGFAVVGAFYLIVTLALFALRKRTLETAIKNKIIYTLAILTNEQTFVQS